MHRQGCFEPLYHPWRHAVGVARAFRPLSLETERGIEDKVGSSFCTLPNTPYRLKCHNTTGMPLGRSEAAQGRLGTTHVPKKSSSRPPPSLALLFVSHLQLVSRCPESPRRAVPLSWPWAPQNRNLVETGKVSALQSFLWPRFQSARWQALEQ